MSEWGHAAVLRTAAIASSSRHSSCLLTPPLVIIADLLTNTDSSHSIHLCLPAPNPTPRVV
jgi:hypothetical protein